MTVQADDVFGLAFPFRRLLFSGLLFVFCRHSERGEESLFACPFCDCSGVSSPPSFVALDTVIPSERSVPPNVARAVTRDLSSDLLLLWPCKILGYPHRFARFLF